MGRLRGKLWSFPFKLCDHLFLGASSAYNASTVLGSDPSASAFAYNDVLCAFDYPLGSFVTETVASPECVCFFSKFDHHVLPMGRLRGLLDFLDAAKHSAVIALDVVSTCPDNVEFDAVSVDDPLAAKIFAVDHNQIV